MKTNKLICLIFTLFVGFTLSSCQLAHESGESVAADDVNEKYEDRMIGVFITDEPLFEQDQDIDYYSMITSVNSSENNTNSVIESETSQKRLYAVLKDRIDKEDGQEIYSQEYAFEKIKGMRYFTSDISASKGKADYVTTSADSIISDGNISYSGGDDSDSEIKLCGTIYFSKRIVLYVNPVYQSPDGKVYAVSGQGCATGCMNSSVKLNQETKVTENKKVSGYKFAIELSLKEKYPTEKTTIIQVDKNDAIISKHEYKPGKVPDAITPDKKCSYFIVKTKSKSTDGDDITTNNIYNFGDKELITFHNDKDGYSIQDSTSLKWTERL